MSSEAQSSASQELLESQPQSGGIGALLQRLSLILSPLCACGFHLVSRSCRWLFLDAVGVDALTRVGRRRACAEAIQRGQSNAFDQQRHQTPSESQSSAHSSMYQPTIIRALPISVDMRAGRAWKVDVGRLGRGLVPTLWEHLRAH